MSLCPFSLPWRLVGWFLVIAVLVSAANARAQVRTIDAEDQGLLRAATGNYFRNDRRAVGSNLDECLKAATPAARSKGKRSQLAKSLLLWFDLAIAYAGKAEEHSRIIRSLPVEQLKAEYRLLAQAAVDGKFPEYWETEPQVWEGINAAIDRGRDNEIQRSRLEVLMMLQGTRVANLIEQIFFGEVRPLDRTVFATSFHDHLPVKHDIGGGRLIFLPGEHVGIKNVGPKPLSNLIVIVDVATTGVSEILSANQEAVLAANLQLGAGNRNPHVRELMRAWNARETAPRTMTFFIPEVSPGDQLYLPVGHLRIEVLKKVTVRLRADDGVAGFESLPLDQISTTKKPSVTEAPKPRPKPKSRLDDERRAKGMLIQAKRLRGKKRETWLRKIMDEYPKTEAAKEAAKLRS